MARSENQKLKLLYDISKIKEQIEDKRLWLKTTFPAAYQAEVGRDEPFFD